MTDNFLARLLLQPPLHKTATGPDGSREAAVVVPLVMRETPHLLLTVRAMTLRQHPGEVAFPGGKRDSTDSSLVETALRETYEEIGLQREQLQILAQLPALSSRRGVKVVPYVATLSADYHLVINPSEVMTVFEVPLQQVLNPNRYRSFSVVSRVGPHKLRVLPHPQFLIWGMSAEILYRLAQQVSSE